ncbi:MULTISPECIES: hypothetical protein [unclassified Halomonas]|uniref:hypothetical protein n=1 Tax=unclassified Halomonas TaxID=2609666 RepID=UPI0007D90D69|nr:MULTISPECIES: hypothetical protein [unclassified Halomonas]MBT2785698.1 hypothetical protein [Halomonas sp. ISL-106]MBT2798752.1 hypothetical protein [Halomonas sp. ISL-104]OAL59121.1 hypothetical protein A6R74_04825 [Halomonas sp. ALS9]
MYENKELEFKFKKPSSKDEYLAALYEEISVNEKSNISASTLKTYVYEILERQKKEDRKRKKESEQKDFNLSWSLGILAFIALLLIFNGSRENHDFNWLQQNSFTIKIWGILLATLYIGVSIEKFSIFRNLWKFGFTKLVASIAVSGLVVFSTGKAAGSINSVFGVDASAFPFTLTFTSSLFFFHYVLPFLALVGIVAILFAFNAIGYIKSKFSDGRSYELPPVHSFVFPILATILLVVFWGWSKNDLSEEALPSKIYKLAHMLDFNSKNQCANVRGGVPVVYLGPSQSTVLADVKVTNVEDLKSFFEREIDVPHKFYRLSCELPEYQSK